MKPHIRIILVEDNPEYRQAIKLALEDEVDLELSRRFGAAEVALRGLQSMAKDEASPDIILLDISLPGISGTDAIASFAACCPDAKIIMLTQSKKEADVLRAVQLGAAGYLLKSSSIDEIVGGIRTVVAGGAPLDPEVAQYVMQTLAKPHADPSLKIDLSPREIEILTLISEGHLKKQIADQLNISENTVADHVKRMYKKLKVQNSPAAIAQAYKGGILPKKDK